MKKNTSVAILITGLFLFSGIAVVALAAFPPDPVKVFLQNNSPLIDPEALMYNGTIQAGAAEFYYIDGSNTILWRRVYYPAVPPGQQSRSEASVCEDIDVAPPEEGVTFFVKQAGQIDDWPIFSFPTGTTEVTEQPYDTPLIEFPESCEPLGICHSCHQPNAPSLPIFAFASPGVLVGTMTISSRAASAPSVGGTAMLTNKFELMAPWITPAALILLIAGIITIRRYKKQS